MYVSYNSHEREIFVCNLKSTCSLEETIMIRLENGLERKKIV